jgi:hypothetical protein
LRRKKYAAAPAEVSKASGGFILPLATMREWLDEGYATRWNRSASASAHIDTVTVLALRARCSED